MNRLYVHDLLLGFNTDEAKEKDIKTNGNGDGSGGELCCTDTSYR